MSNIEKTQNEKISFVLTAEMSSDHFGGHKFGAHDLSKFNSHSCGLYLALHPLNPKI